MAPKETTKVTPKERTIVKSLASKSKTPASPLKKTMSSKPATAKVPLKNNNAVGSRQRTSTVPKVATPKPKENKSVPLPSSVTKSAKKASWKRRPKAAHSGVPVPEKMKKLLEKVLQESECDL
ncbi:unnamed protein product [Diatraea saccharalis]|uniref:Uncharacterized protein n=1 Tax=Diatraea saccharalis TaxID=40085 RepID=A0A9N9RCM7_9NEOP|nr:unnamed protein product [Diatraea saccharalis]